MVGKPYFGKPFFQGGEDHLLGRVGAVAECGMNVIIFKAHQTIFSCLTFLSIT